MEELGGRRRFRLSPRAIKQMGGCQNDGPFLGTLNIRCRITIGIQKGTIILTTTQMYLIDRISIKGQGKARQKSTYT